jgi:hypothetical protein
MRTKAVVPSAVLALSACSGLCPAEAANKLSRTNRLDGYDRDQTAPSNTTIEGCLTGTTGNCMLTDSSGM